MGDAPVRTQFDPVPVRTHFGHAPSRWAWVAGLLLAAALVAAALGGGARLARAQARAGGPAIALAPVGHIGGPTLAVASDGRYVFAGFGPKLAVLEPGDGREPRVLGESPVLPGVVRDVAVLDAVAFVAYTDRDPLANDFGAGLSREGRGGLALIGFADPSRPRLLALVDDLDARLARLLRPSGTDVGALDLPPEPPAIFRVLAERRGGRTRVYLATAAGLLILDASQAASPELIGAHLTGEAPVWSAALVGRRLYLGLDNSLQVLDVDDPRHPLLLACGPDLGFGLARDPRSPGLAAAGRLGPRGPDTAGGGGQGADGTGDPCAGTGLGAQVMAVGDGRVVIMPPQAGVIVVLDVRRPDEPAWQGFGLVGDAVTDLAAAGGRFFSLGIGGRLEVFDASAFRRGGDPFEQFHEAIGVAEIPGRGVRLAAGPGARLYLAAGAQGLRVVDAGDPELPLEIGAALSAPAPRDLRVAGTQAFIADAVTGLQIFDLAEPARPRKLGAYSLAGATELALAGGRAYLRTDAGDLRIVQVAEPRRPREIGALALPGGIESIAASGDRLYLGTRVLDENEDQRLAVQVLDLADPRNPRPLATIGPARSLGASRLLLQDDRLYLLGEVGLELIDLLAAPLPRRAGTYYLPRLNQESPGLALAPGHAFVAAGDTGFVMVNLADPGNPIEVGAQPGLGSSSRAVAAQGSRAFVAQRPALGAVDPERLGRAPITLRVMDFAEPWRPRQEALAQSVPYLDPIELESRGGAGAALAISGDHVYLADTRTGVYIWRIVEGPRLYLPSLGRGE